MALFTGLPGLVELPNILGWDPRTGATLARRWRGTQVLVESAAVLLRAEGVKYQISPSEDGGYWTLTGYYGAEQTQPPNVPLSSTWSLVGNDLEKSLWELPKVVEELKKVQGDAKEREIAKFKRLIDALLNGEDEALDPAHEGQVVKATLAEVGFACNFLNWMDRDIFFDLIKARRRGAESWTLSQFVLRHVLVIAWNSTIKPALTNVGKVYTTEQLRAVEDVPTTICFDLPNGYWLKRTPTVEQSGATKWTITQEWWHADDYDSFIYERAT